MELSNMDVDHSTPRKRKKVKNKEKKIVSDSALVEEKAQTSQTTAKTEDLSKKDVDHTSPRKRKKVKNKEQKNVSSSAVVEEKAQTNQTTTKKEDISNKDADHHTHSNRINVTNKEQINVSEAVVVEEKAEINQTTAQNDYLSNKDVNQPTHSKRMIVKNKEQTNDSDAAVVEKTQTIETTAKREDLSNMDVEHPTSKNIVNKEQKNVSSSVVVEEKAQTNQTTAQEEDLSNKDVDHHRHRNRMKVNDMEQISVSDSAVVELNAQTQTNAKNENLSNKDLDHHTPRKRKKSKNKGQCNVLDAPVVQGNAQTNQSTAKNDDYPKKDVEYPTCRKKKKIKHMEQTNVSDAAVVGENSETNQTTAKNEDFPNNPKFVNLVTPEEISKLKEFQVLDEVKADDEDFNDDASESSEELHEEEIEKMLNENLPEDFKSKPQPKEKPFITRQKVILDEKGVNHWEVLPLDWMMVRHYSGMPVYVHRTTRVCTLSKPYFLGKGNTRRHDIPITAIPCLAYRRAIEEEKKQEEIDRLTEEEIRKGTWINLIKKPDKPSNEPNGNSDAHKTVKKCPYSMSNIKHIHSDSSVECPVASKVLNNVDEKRDKSQKDNTPSVENKSENSNNDVEMSISVENVGNESNQPENADDGVFKVPEVPKDNGAEPSNKDVTSTEPLKIRQPVVLPGGIVMPSPQVENINTSWKTQQLTHEQVNDYCKKLFQFKTVRVMHFNTWADRRKYTKARKTLQCPALPDGTKLITIPVRSDGQDSGGKPTKRDWVMNMDGRSYLSVFHEYVWRALHKQPMYEFSQLENAATPYQATVYIGGMQYGVGRGSSKRQAKAAAARASIRILIPGVAEHLDAAAGAASGAPQPDPDDPNFTFFDYVGIEDPRIAELCASTCEPSPHAILRTCLLRNFGAGDRQINIEMKKLEYQKIELTMKVGKHEAKVVCKNKKTAKQRASQIILQLLHPHVTSWGSLLRLYGSKSVKSCKQRKQEEQQITLLQDRARHNRPNAAVLAKLRREMGRLHGRDTALVAIGTLVLDEALPTHSGSNLNNVDL